MLAIPSGYLLRCDGIRYDIVHSQTRDDGSVDLEVIFSSLNFRDITGCMNYLFKFISLSTSRDVELSTEHQNCACIACESDSYVDFGQILDRNSGRDLDRELDQLKLTRELELKESWSYLSF
jgi:hypothetical protein